MSYLRQGLLKFISILSILAFNSSGLANPTKYCEPTPDGGNGVSDAYLKLDPKIDGESAKITEWLNHYDDQLSHLMEQMLVLTRPLPTTPSTQDFESLKAEFGKVSGYLQSVVTQLPRSY